MTRVLFLIVAGVLIGFGGYRQFAQPAVSAADQARCEGIIRAEYADSPESIAQLSASCTDVGMVAMMDARSQSASAEGAAQSIARANQGDVTASVINFGLIGLGVGALGAAFGRRKRAV